MKPWAADDLRRAFVAGAKWWEWKKENATMWPSDQGLAEEEAERHYPEGKPRNTRKDDVGTFVPGQGWIVRMVIIGPCLEPNGDHKTCPVYQRADMEAETCVKCLCRCHVEESYGHS